jgi:hypothetical protein
VVLEVGFDAGFSSAAQPLNRAASIPSDDGRRLAWLAQQVAPTISKLAASGRLAEVYSALRLPFPQDEDKGHGNQRG